MSADLAVDYISVAPDECGATFQLTRESYCRLANTALNFPCRQANPNQMFIRKLETTGAAVEIYTAQFLFTISVWSGSISLVVESLDYANSEAVLFTGKDTRDDWQRLRFAANRLLG